MDRVSKISFTIPHSLAQRIRRERKISPAAYVLGLVIDDVERHPGSYHAPGGEEILRQSQRRKRLRQFRLDDPIDGRLI
jgi:hypothetical protein